MEASWRLERTIICSPAKSLEEGPWHLFTDGWRDGSLLTGQTSATLSFSPLRQVDSGVYTCEATRSSISVTSAGVSITVVGECNWIMHIMEVTYCLSAPAVSAVITASGTPDEGQSYSLTCELRGAELLAITNPRFRWDEVGGAMGILRAATLTFNPLTIWACRRLHVHSQLCLPISHWHSHCNSKSYSYSQSWVVMSSACLWESSLHAND